MSSCLERVVDRRQGITLALATASVLIVEEADAKKRKKRCPAELGGGACRKSDTR